MHRSYRNIQQYEEEILRMRETGMTRREIGEELGLSKEQIKAFISRYNKKQMKIKAGISLKRKGRPPKNYVVSEEDRIGVFWCCTYKLGQFKVRRCVFYSAMRE